MNKPCILLYTLVFFLFSCAKGQAVDADQFQKGLNQPGVQLLDVRSSEEYHDGHLEGAMLANINEESEFDRRTEALDKGRPVYVYCLAGSRSHKAAGILKERGFRQVVELNGGITAWKKAGKPVEGKSAAPLITKAAYEAMTRSASIVLVDFSAPWCPPCRKMEPVIAELEREFKGKVSVVQVDGGTQIALMNTYRVEQLPSFILYQEGREVWRGSGLIEKSFLQKKMQQLSAP